MQRYLLSSQAALRCRASGWGQRCCGLAQPATRPRRLPAAQAFLPHSSVDEPDAPAEPSARARSSLGQRLGGELRRRAHEEDRALLQEASRRGAESTSLDRRPFGPEPLQLRASFDDDVEYEKSYEEDGPVEGPSRGATSLRPRPLHNIHTLDMSEPRRSDRKRTQTQFF